MTQTANFQLSLLEIGQKDKEVTINTNFSTIDTKSLKYLGELAVDPASTGIAHGSTYYSTTASKLKVLKTNGTWANVA